MAVRYLAYGSNLHPLRLKERAPSAELIGTASVSGFSLVFSKRGQDGSGKCTITACGGAFHGAIYEMSRADKARLDSIEGVGRGYERHMLSLPDFGDCATYVAESAWIDDSLRPFCWYRDLVLAGALVHGFGETYLDRIRLLQTESDGDEVRREQNERLVERLYRGRPGLKQPS